MQVPFNDLSRRARLYQKEYGEAIMRVISSGWYILGPEVKAFEETFAKYVGVKHAVGLNSGTDAIALGLIALGVSEGDEVITVGNTATPTVAAIRMAKGKPVFCDIDEMHLMDPASLEKYITPQTKAIVPVHLYGFPADMPAIMAIAKKHGIKVLEDAAQAHGAVIGGVPVGTFGDAAAFSFYPTKNLGALGDGGAVVTNDDEVAARVKRIRMYGERARYASVEEGVNSRLDEMQAALLSFNLVHLPEQNIRRKEIAARYIQGIKNNSVILPNQSVGEREGVWHLFVVQVPDRDHFMTFLKEKGIGTAIHYPTPIYRHRAYAFLNVEPNEYPVTEKIVPHIVSLPIFPELTNEEVDAVITAINAYESAN